MAATRNINRQPREYITRDLNQVQREIASVIKILNEIMNNKYLRSRLYDMALKFSYVDLFILYNIHVPSSEQTSDHPAATETVQLEPCSDYALKNIHNFHRFAGSKHYTHCKVFKNHKYMKVHDFLRSHNNNQKKKKL